MSIENLTPSQLRQAAGLKEQIEALEQKLASFTTSSPAQAIPAPVKAKRGRLAKLKPALEAEPVKSGRKGGMSAAGKARIAAAQKARWAKVKAAKGESPKVVKPEVKQKAAKRKMSAAGRAAIIAAQKARWAKIKAAKKA